MNPARVDRTGLDALTDLPNVGPSIAGDLRLIGVQTPTDLLGRDAWAMYHDLCRITGQRHDPCVIDVFLSITDFIEGGAPKPWWHYTGQRKRDSGLGTRDSGLGTRDSGLGTRDSGLGRDNH